MKRLIFTINKFTTFVIFLILHGIVNAQFTPGNVVVLQLGDGVNTLTNTGNPITLREFSPSGSPLYSVNVISTNSNAIISSGAASSEGILSNSSDKRFLVFAGYNSALPNTIPLAASASSVIPRSVGIVDAAGGYSMIASSISFYTGNNIRAACSDGQNNYWGAGGVDGTNYFGASATATNVQNIKTNTRAVSIFGGQLYLSTQSASGSQTLLGIYSIGSGMPLTSAQTITNVINTGTGSQPVQFYFQPGLTPTVCYIADARTTTGGGIQKWIYASSTWSLAYTIPTSSTSAGANGIVADFSSSNPMVYATTVEGTNNRLVSVLDNGSSATATTIATSTNNTIFRGLAFSPCSTPSIVSLTSNGPVCGNQPISLSVTATGGSLTSYAWYGSGTFNSSNTPSSSVTGYTNGTFSIQATNGCGFTYSTITVSITPTPTLSINASTTSICAGQTINLTGSGATSYTWSNGIINGASFTPSGNATYTLTGSNGGCVGTATIGITINTIAVLASSVTICSGQSATLTASGAQSYTWNSGSNSNSIVVNPTITTSYTISGTSNFGCSNTSTTQVAVTTSPQVIVNSATICSGKTATIIAGGINTFTWNNGANTNSIIVSPTINTTYSVNGGLTGCPGFASGVATINVNPSPTISVTGNTFVCVGSTVTQTAAGANSYSWSNGVVTSTANFSPTSNTSYTVTGTNNFGCSSSYSNLINVISLPTVNISSSATLTCAGIQVTLTANGASSYTWSSGSNNSSIVISPTINSSYSVTGANASGCTSNFQINQTVNNCNSIKMNDLDLNEFNIYPNPTLNDLFISYAKDDYLEVKIVNSLGTVVLNIADYYKNRVIDVSALTKGVYLIKIKSEFNEVNKKLIIE